MVATGKTIAKLSPRVKSGAYAYQEVKDKINNRRQIFGQNEDKKQQYKYTVLLHEVLETHKPAPQYAKEYLRPIKRRYRYHVKNSQSDIHRRDEEHYLYKGRRYGDNAGDGKADSDTKK